jgi:O-antigen ligase
MLSLGAAAVGKHASPRDIILWLFMTTAVYMLIGLGCEIYYGKFLPLTPDYRFSGSLHPNHQGINCAIVVLTGFAASRSVNRGGAFFIVFALMAIVFLVLTGSRTAFASGMAGLLVYLSVVWSRSSKIALFFVLSTGFCLLLLLVGDKLFSAIWEGLLLGRESSSTSSLTGRIPLWIDCLDHAKGRLLIGYGFTSFFNPARIAKVSATVEWAVGELHSAYLDLLLGVGILGPIAFVAIMVLGIKDSIERFKQLSSHAYAGFAAILVFASLNGVLEITVVSNGMLSFVVMILIAHVGFSVPQDRHRRILSRPGEICSQEESLAGKTPCVRA